MEAGIYVRRAGQRAQRDPQRRGEERRRKRTRQVEGGIVKIRKANDIEEQSKTGRSIRIEKDRGHEGGWAVGGGSPNVLLQINLLFMFASPLF